MPKTFLNSINQNFSYLGWHQCQVSKVLESSSAVRSPLPEVGSSPHLGSSRFQWPYLGKTWSQPLCEWKQKSALSLHRPRSREIQYLAYLRDQNLALWGRWRGRGIRRGRGPAAAACWPIGTPAPGCGTGCHARLGLWTAWFQRQEKTFHWSNVRRLMIILLHSIKMSHWDQVGAAELCTVSCFPYFIPIFLSY